MLAAPFFQLAVCAVALRLANASLRDCIDTCVKSPAPAGHFECCTDPKSSSFQAPSCATGCLMAEYAHNLAGCNKMCEDARGPPDGQCSFTIPNGPTIRQCDTCNCGLRDCPAHPKPEPEICKDPANGGPADGDCGWVNRCRGSVEGCKKGCKWGQQMDGGGTLGLIISVVLLLGGAIYAGGGVALGARAGAGKRGLSAHPHFAQWQELRGLVLDGARFTQRRLRGGGEDSSSGPKQSLLGDAGGSGSERGSGSKSKKEKKEKKEKKSKGSSSGGSPRSESSPKRSSSSSKDPKNEAREAPPPPSDTDAAKFTTAGGGGRCE